MNIHEIDNELCVKCKMNPRRMLCGRPKCPILLKLNALNPIRPFLLDKTELTGPTPPAFFVGSYGYPKVRAGAMIPVPVDLGTDDVIILDEPDLWLAGRDAGVEMQQILNWRSSLVRTSELLAVDVLDKSRELATAREALMSEVPINLSASFEKSPVIQLKLNQFTQPVGPHAKGIKKLEIEEYNVNVPRHVDKVVDDTDLLAVDAVNDLYSHDLTVTRINRLLSAGLLGTGKKRKLVPTRWSITATDDMLGKKLIEDIKNYQELGEYRLFQNSGYLDNWYNILLVPREWSFEQIEAWYPNWTGADEENLLREPSFAVDYEFYKGRTTYASNVAGGYYAGRLPVLEYLKGIKRQAAAIIFREIRAGYVVPLGVWQVRQNVRSALFNAKSEPTDNYESYTSLEEALDRIEANLGKSLKPWIKKMTLLKQIKTQRRLIDFFSN